ncbi:MAG: FAD/NAD(P)-binding oxidoreductase [Gemmatimonadota bacterium]|nr:FAD/NAD(P)-binding oxidoreductase [Gemmatimonadota bacterium]
MSARHESARNTSARYVIVGSGIAGLSAAESIRANDRTASITMLSVERGPFYSRPGLAYMLTGEVPDEQLTIRSARDVDALRVERRHGRAVQVDAAAREVICDDGARVPWDRLLIATGAESVRAGFPGEELDGVVHVDGLEEARDFVQRTSSAAGAVVVGGGSTALELVEGLHARGVATHYLMRGERYWAKVFDAVESAIVEARLIHDGVALHRFTSVRRAIGEDGRLVGVETTTGERIPCTLLAVAVGIRPRLALARSAGLASDRGILVNEFLESSLPGVYAAGDVAQVFDPVTGVSLLDTLWASALQQGRTAGLNMGGRRVPHRKRVPINVTRVAGITTTIIGAVGAADDPDLLTLTRGQSERWARDPDAWVVSGARVGDRLRVMVSGRAIVGAVVMGDQRASHALAHLVGEAVDIAALRPALNTDAESAMDLLLAFCDEHVDDDAAEHR